MKISYNWLKEYINIDITAEKLGSILTDIGLEVESIEPWESIEGGLQGFVTGKVLTCSKHPNADNLSLTEVDIGTGEILKIVCGAPNVEAGQKVIVATIGSIIYHSEGTFTIKKSKIRGELSEGMICAEDELSIGNSHDGILVLRPDAPIGIPAMEFFELEKDVVFEIGLTPNRIDSASHYGVARDLAAFLSQTQKVELKRPSVENFRIDNKSRTIPVSIENADACKRYSGVTISGIEIKESPEWLKNRIKAIGLRPINNVVDATNFVLHETGQPLHAFDADCISGDKVIVKNLEKGTKFETLDEIEHELTDEDLMICNTKEGMCLAGVFGGRKSGVTTDTKNIFLECANFNPVNIRKTAKRFNLSTDSSFRFERGADPNITVYTLKRCAMLIKKLAGGTISSDIQDIYPNKIENQIVEVTYHNIARLIGRKLEKDIIKSILVSLEITIENETEEGLSLSVPTYRVDVSREADIIEEILRIYGYNNIEVGNEVHSAISYYPKPDKEKVKNMVSDLLSNNGFNEIWCNSLTRADYYDKTESYQRKEVIEIFNPLSSDLNGMRQTLLFGGMEVVAHNVNRKNLSLKLYEFGTCFALKGPQGEEDWEKNYKEEECLSLFITGQKNPITWNILNEPTSFYDLKAYTENILRHLNLNPERFFQEDLSNDIFAEGLKYSIDGDELVSMGRLNSKLQKQFDIDAEIFYAEFKWNILLQELKNHSIIYQPLSKFPEVRRDLALLLDKNVRFADIKRLARETEGKLLKSIFLFDVYEGKNIEQGKKSYAVGFILQDNDKTLTDKHIEKAMNRFISVFKSELNAVIR